MEYSGGCGRGGGGSARTYGVLSSISLHLAHNSLYKLVNILKILGACQITKIGSRQFHRISHCLSKIIGLVLYTACTNMSNKIFLFQANAICECHSQARTFQSCRKFLSHPGFEMQLMNTKYIHTVYRCHLRSEKISG
jgi:hypothetical protein